MSKAKDKTNAMRILDSVKANYQSHTYSAETGISGMEVAEALNQNPAKVFKTLVTQAASKNYYVFMVPVAKSLDLKKAAEIVGEKKIEMIPSKTLLPLTGYVHGGCSPIGMKKVWPLVIDQTAKEQDTIIFSAGKIGYQVEMPLEELQKAVNFTLADIVTG